MASRRRRYKRREGKRFGYGGGFFLQGEDVDLID